MFFVISGFVIAQTLNASPINTISDLFTFWARRLRRILPALVVVAVVTLVLCYLFYLPEKFVEFGESLSGLGTFSSNLALAAQDGYFSGPSHTKPLLHTWSLSVELQYYALVPALGLLGLGLLKLPKVWFYGGLAAASFLLAVWLMATGRQSAAFFEGLPRMWEILAGALCALVPALRSALLATILRIVGLTLVLGAVLGFTSGTPFPGPTALVPVVGTMLLVLPAQRAVPVFDVALSDM